MAKTNKTDLPEDPREILTYPEEKEHVNDPDMASVTNWW